MRVEDLDLPRVVAGSADRILLLLDQLGFEWDGPILYQSQRFERYLEILDSLRSHGFLFDCSCSRREILASALIRVKKAPPFTLEHVVMDRLERVPPNMR